MLVINPTSDHCGVCEPECPDERSCPYESGLDKGSSSHHLFRRMAELTRTKDSPPTPMSTGERESSTIFQRDPARETRRQRWTLTGYQPQPPENDRVDPSRE